MVHLKPLTRLLVSIIGLLVSAKVKVNIGVQVKCFFSYVSIIKYCRSLMWVSLIRQPVLSLLFQKIHLTFFISLSLRKKLSQFFGREEGEKIVYNWAHHPQKYYVVYALMPLPYSV